MPNELEAAASNFSEQAKKHQIALYYTFGDEEKAKKMVNNAYTDLHVIKAYYSSSSVYGAFIIFLNTVYLKAVHAYTLVTRSFDLVDMKTSRDWRSFERMLMDIAKQGHQDDMFTNQLRDQIMKGFTFQEISNISKLIDQDNQIAANHYLQKFISALTGLQNMELSADYEKISSLSMEIYSLTSTKLSPAELTKGQGKEAPAADVKIEKTEDVLEGKEIKLILSGALILSPIKGKDISTLVVGDRIMISIVDPNPRGIDVARAFNAYDPEKGIRPIPGRIVSLKYDGAYNIVAIVAKGIYIKIIEEESNIKIGMDPAHYSPEGGKKDDEGGKSGLTLAVLAVIFIALVGVVLFFVFKL